jgi:hypothetical protein
VLEEVKFEAQEVVRYSRAGDEVAFAGEEQDAVGAAGG